MESNHGLLAFIAHLVQIVTTFTWARFDGLNWLWIKLEPAEAQGAGSACKLDLGAAWRFFWDTQGAFSEATLSDMYSINRKLLTFVMQSCNSHALTLNLRCFEASMIEVGAGPEGGRPRDLWSHWKLVMCFQIAVCKSSNKGLLSVISLGTVVGFSKIKYQWSYKKRETNPTQRFKLLFL